ncbi:MAG: hypothetical protein GEU71_10755 [Actinobacteria bacterium]|nr:hypothetical protein [Actinomycetota bacterium]
MSPELPALAHGVGRVYESPIPLWLYLGGAGLVVALSFILRALTRKTPSDLTERRISGARAAGMVRIVFKIGGVALLALMLIAGIVVRSEGLTTTSLLFWLGLVVGTVFLSSLAGGIWAAADPWATLEELYRIEGVETARRTPPWWIGPALVYALFWFELVSGVGFDDFWVVTVLIGYSIYAFSLRAVFAENWQTADPLSILYGFAGRVAPLRLGRDGIYARSPLAGIDEHEPMTKALFASLFVVLASTTLDNIRETVAWTDFRNSTGLDTFPPRLVDSLAFAVFALLFLAPFLLAMMTARRREESVVMTGRRFGWSLVPIGIAYVLSHNAPLLITGVPQLIRLLSDPFDLGWNILGTGGAFADFQASPQFVWFLEIALIVGGHILGVLSAHRTAVRLAPSHGAAVRSQYALTGLMTLYTVATLALLAQPLVT